MSAINEPRHAKAVGSKSAFTVSTVCVSASVAGLSDHTLIASLCSFMRSMISLVSPAHSVCDTPPGVPRIAGVDPAGYPSRNHSGLSFESIRYVSNSSPASRIHMPMRRQYGQKGITGPMALSASKMSPEPYDGRHDSTALMGFPGTGVAGGAG